jgi:hypothetical protein
MKKGENGKDIFKDIKGRNMELTLIGKYTPNGYRNGILVKRISD